ncbi:adult cuticle protein 1-like [Uranotaenia lowii]|uniref:adult cuticle protein 1-like n=1 Tax=Uranotaenia lowii TaxID=190385 RepID=UPI002479D173|nr:adult cuticle protein 1-like [Uranotaenia lowii]
MKCIAAVVMMACAVAANAHYIPSVYAHQVAPVLTYAAHHHGPTVVQSNDYHHGWAGHHQAPVVAYSNGHWDQWGHHDVHHHQVPAAVAIAAPVAYNTWDHHNHHAHGHAHAVAVAPVHHSASYVAANRGAVHKAPLPGHIVNQKSLNLAPAPGTL